MSKTTITFEVSAEAIRNHKAMNLLNRYVDRREHVALDGANPSDRLSCRISDALGTPWRFAIDRNVACRSYDVTICCRSCGARSDSDVADYALELQPDVFDKFADSTIAKVLAARDVGVIDEHKGCFCVDRYTPSQCLMHWLDNQRTHEKYGDAGAYAVLTERQIAMARRMWSQALRDKQRAAAEKERNRVLCDSQDEP